MPRADMPPLVIVVCLDALLSLSIPVDRHRTCTKLKCLSQCIYIFFFKFPVCRYYLPNILVSHTPTWRLVYTPSQYYEYNRSRSSSPLRSRLPLRRVTDRRNPLDGPSQQTDTTMATSVEEPIQNETSRRPPLALAKQTPYRLPCLSRDHCPACLYPP
jgi:hypothetical protein